MKKILVLGSTGMLGHQVYYRLKSDLMYEVYDISYRNKLHEGTQICDITDFKKLSSLIKEISPAVIVNCIGVLIKGSNENPKNAILINSYLPHWLVEEADSINAKVIHVSTDCVFSGKKGDYEETDFRDADDLYGRSKSLGEIFSEKHLTLRTSIIGPELKSNGEGIFHWFFLQRGNVNGFTNAYWGGVTTLELAKVIGFSIENILTGVLHVTNGDKISKYNLLVLFKEIWNIENIEVLEFSGKNVDKSLCRTNRVDFQIPTYYEMFNDLKNWMDNNPKLFSNSQINFFK